MKSFRRDFISRVITVLIVATSFIFSSLVFAQDKAKGYTYDLKELVEKAKENIDKIDKELSQKRAEQLAKQKEEQAREHFQKGQALCEQGKLKEAKKEWQRVLELTESPEMKEYIEKTRVIVKEEKEIQRGIEFRPLRNGPKLENSQIEKKIRARKEAKKIAENKIQTE